MAGNFLAAGGLLSLEVSALVEVEKPKYDGYIFPWIYLRAR